MGGVIGGGGVGKERWACWVWVGLVGEGWPVGGGCQGRLHCK